MTKAVAMAEAPAIILRGAAKRSRLNPQLPISAKLNASSLAHSGADAFGEFAIDASHLDQLVDPGFSHTANAAEGLEQLAASLGSDARNIL